MILPQNIARLCRWRALWKEVEEGWGSGAARDRSGVKELTCEEFLFLLGIAKVNQ